MARTQICYVEYAPTGTPTKCYFKASAMLYTDENKTDTGITPVSDTVAGNVPLYDTAELMRVGYLERVNVQYKTGAGETAKRGTHRLFCDPSKKQSFMSKCKGENPGTIGGKPITGATAAIMNQVVKY